MATIKLISCRLWYPLARCHRIDYFTTKWHYYKEVNSVVKSALWHTASYTFFFFLNWITELYNKYTIYSLQFFFVHVFLCQFLQPWILWRKKLKRKMLELQFFFYKLTIWWMIINKSKIMSKWVQIKTSKSLI